MAEPFRGQILPVAFAFAPSGWAKCDGQLLLTAQNPELFKLIGTTYGGNGDNTFALPDLRGRAPIHQGGGAGFHGAARSREQAPDEGEPHDQACAENDQGGGPLDGGFGVHDRSFGAMPSGQP